MAYLKYNPMAELGKLSQGKPTTIEPWIIAKLAIDRIRELERAVRDDDDLTELERMFRL